MTPLEIELHNRSVPYDIPDTETMIELFLDKKINIWTPNEQIMLLIDSFAVRMEGVLVFQVMKLKSRAENSTFSAITHIVTTSNVQRNISLHQNLTAAFQFISIWGTGKTYSNAERRKNDRK